MRNLRAGQQKEPNVILYGFSAMLIIYLNSKEISLITDWL